MRAYITILLALAILATPVYAGERAFPTTVTQADVRAKYEAAGAGGEKVKVLIMPGHEPDFGGTELGVLKERNLVVDISQYLAAHLESDARLQVVVARDTAAWLSELEEYFEKEWRDIQRFVKDKKKAMKWLSRKGDIEERTFEVAHNTAPEDSALRLYGITKWANEEGFDLVIHPHLNDNPGAANHSGFAVYIPDAEYGNAEASRPLGEAIARVLNRFNASSTLPIENYAVVEDQSLIALGAYNTADFPVALIEYAYIYESKIKYEGAREVVLDDMAYHTYRAIQEYLGAPLLVSDTLALPHAWALSELPLKISDTQVYALQVALKKLGFYPPPGELLVGCPISGYMGECTKKALRAFQASRGLEETGTIGPRTKEALHAAGF